jgi:hypothetical protein
LLLRTTVVFLNPDTQTKTEFETQGSNFSELCRRTVHVELPLTF